jgi:RNA polymerase sigma-70 factor (ECF subfamily)
MSSDADLLRGASRRDRESVAALYDRYGSRMYAVALRIAGEEAAPAVLEAVFAALCDGRLSIAGSGSPAASLIRATRDRALAGRQTQTPAPHVDDSMQLENDDPSQTGRIEKPLTARALVEAIYYDGLSLAEAATRWQLSEAMVRTKLEDGMAELRAQLPVSANHE